MFLNTFNLQTKEDIETIKINNMEVKVKQYLPSAEKNNLLQIAIQSADTSSILDTFALDIIFHTYLVIKYTDIQFAEDDLNDIFALYDKLETNNIVNAVLAAIPEKEYDILRDSLAELAAAYNSYSTSSVVVVNKLLTFFNSIGEELKNIDSEKIKEIAGSIVPKAE